MTREAVTQTIARFHRNACYPEAMAVELSACADQILALSVDASLAKQLQRSIERNSRLVNRVKALESFCTNSAKHVTDGEVFAGHVADVCRRIALDEVT